MGTLCPNEARLSGSGSCRHVGTLPPPRGGSVKQPIIAGGPAQNHRRSCALRVQVGLGTADTVGQPDDGKGGRRRSGPALWRVVDRAVGETWEWELASVCECPWRSAKVYRCVGYRVHLGVFDTLTKGKDGVTTDEGALLVRHACILDHTAASDSLTTRWGRSGPRERERQRSISCWAQPCKGGG